MINGNNLIISPQRVEEAEYVFSGTQSYTNYLPTYLCTYYIPRDVRTLLVCYIVEEKPPRGFIRDIIIYFYCHTRGEECSFETFYSS